jgi:hypothetical protein
MIVAKSGVSEGMKIDRGTEEIGENMLQCHFLHHKSHMH